MGAHYYCYRAARGAGTGHRAFSQHSRAEGEGEDGSSLFETLLGNGSLAAVADIPTV